MCAVLSMAASHNIVLILSTAYTSTRTPNVMCYFDFEFVGSQSTVFLIFPRFVVVGGWIFCGTFFGNFVARR